MKSLFKKLSPLLLILFIIISSVSTFKLLHEHYIHDLQHKLKIDLTHNSMLVQHNLLELFNKYDYYLQILKNELLNDKKDKIKILNNFLNLDNDLVGYGYILPNGQVLYNSSNVNPNAIPNFLENPKTKDTFKEALKTDNAVLGRTYLFKNTNNLIIPIRKRIHSNNKTIAVIATGINIEKVFDSFLSSKTMSKYTIILINDTTNRIQYINKKYSIRYDDLLNTNIKISNEPQNLTIDLNNTKISLLAKVSKLDKYGLTFILGVDKKEFTVFKNEWTQKALTILVFFNLISIFLIILSYKSFKDNHDTLKEMAITDSLTSLGNRARISDWIINNKTYSIIVIDINNFKYWNDLYGISYGDRILKEFGRVINSALEDNDIAIRFSSDDFIIFTTQINDIALNMKVEKILNLLEIDTFFQKHKISIAIAIVLNDNSISFDELKREAEWLLFKAPKDKNSINIFSEDDIKEFKEMNTLNNKILDGLNNNEFFMVYQPQVDKDSEIIGVEALIRWKNPELGFINPEKFIRIAEKNGQIKILGDFILNQVLKDASKILEVEPSLNISINISVNQFMDTSFIEKLKLGLNIHKIPFEAITLEVTESIFIMDIDYMRKILSDLKKLNIKLSLDDFGTGYSSLSSIKNLEIDELKIDKSFVDDMELNEVNQKIPETIIKMGKIMHMSIVAEGVERDSQKKLLESFGCDYFQGYLFYKPMKLDDLLKILKNNSIS